MRLLGDGWEPEARRGRTARATGDEDSDPVWMLSVCPTLGGKYVSVVERKIPYEFFCDGPWDNQAQAKRSAVEQARVLIEATQTGLSGGTL